jgi:hypothetical protein
MPKRIPIALVVVLLVPLIGRELPAQATSPNGPAPVELENAATFTLLEGNFGGLGRFCLVLEDIRVEGRGDTAIVVGKRPKAEILGKAGETFRIEKAFVSRLTAFRDLDDAMRISLRRLQEQPRNP